jgi:hypothetical protein
MLAEPEGTTRPEGTARGKSDEDPIRLEEEAVMTRFGDAWR